MKTSRGFRPPSCGTARPRIPCLRSLKTQPGEPQMSLFKSIHPSSFWSVAFTSVACLLGAGGRPGRSAQRDRQLPRPEPVDHRRCDRPLSAHQACRQLGLRRARSRCGAVSGVEELLPGRDRRCGRQGQQPAAHLGAWRQEQGVHRDGHEQQVRSNAHPPGPSGRVGAAAGRQRAAVRSGVRSGDEPAQ